MAMSHHLLICNAIKVPIILLTIVTLILLDPTYATTYISVNYEIVFIYIVSALSLLYCLISMVVYYAFITRRDDAPITNCALSEAVFAGAGMMGWLVVCGIAGTVSQRTSVETGEASGWMAACAGIIVACFVALAVVAVLNVLRDKFFSVNRNSKYRYSSGRL
jgi:hypothetical protein